MAAGPSCACWNDVAHASTTHRDAVTLRSKVGRAARTSKGRVQLGRKRRSYKVRLRAWRSAERRLERCVYNSDKVY